MNVRSESADRSSPSPRRSLIALAALTVGLGMAVAISWFTFGRGQSYAPDLAALATAGHIPIYLTQFLMVAAVAYVAARAWRGGISPVALGTLVFGAWIGEGVALTAFGTLIANELTPLIAWEYWLVATAGPLQPLAALAGGWMGLRR